MHRLQNEAMIRIKQNFEWTLGGFKPDLNGVMDYVFRQAGDHKALETFYVQQILTCFNQ